jgi:hypothetical protein
MEFAFMAIMKEQGIIADSKDVDVLGRIEGTRSWLSCCKAFWH